MPLKIETVTLQIRRFPTTPFLLQKPIRIMAYLYLPACLIDVPDLEYASIFPFSTGRYELPFHFVHIRLLEVQEIGDKS